MARQGTVKLCQGVVWRWESTRTLAAQGALGASAALPDEQMSQSRHNDFDWFATGRRKASLSDQLTSRRPLGA